MLSCRIFLALAFVVATANASIIFPSKLQPAKNIYQNEVPKGWAHRQKLVMLLLHDITENENDPIITRMAESFTFYDVAGKYKDPSVILHIKEIFERNGFSTNEAEVSEYDEEHLNQLRVLCQLFYNATSFDTFITAAAWVRQNVNSEIFVDAFYAALMKRSDCEDIYLPPLYEILPYNFVRAEVINKLKMMMSTKIIPNDGTVHVETNVMTIDMNYTGAFFKNDEESKLAYFREDIGLNAFYFLHSLKMKACLKNTTLDNGMWWYYTIQQLNARYNLERLANGFEVIDGLSWEEPVVDGYDPDLYSRNMNKLPRRENFFNMQTDPNFLQVTQADLHLVNYPFTDLNATDAMNMMMTMINDDFEIKARKLLGGASSSDNGAFSAMEHYATSLRDPVFWQLNKHIVDISYSYMETLTPYTVQELLFPGVLINNVDIKKMQTFFDYYVTDVIEASDATNYFAMKVGQPRLNHKPYSILINITSAVTQKSKVKIFIGPKSSATGFQRFNSDLDTTKMNFMLLDSFDFYLHTGVNILTRKSGDSSFFSSDFVSSEQINNSIKSSEMGMPALPKLNNQNSVHFPARLAIPKGTSEGFSFRIYVIVAPYVKNDVGEAFKMIFNEDVLSFGYPFDRKIEDVGLFNQPNMMFKEVLIFHKGDNKVLNYGGPGITKNWFWAEPYVYDPNQSNYKPKPEKSYKSDEYMPKFNNVADSNQNSQADSLVDTGMFESLGTVKMFGNKVKENDSIKGSSTENILPAEGMETDDRIELNNQKIAMEMANTQIDEASDVNKNLVRSSVPILKKSKTDKMNDISQLDIKEIEEQLKMYHDLLDKSKQLKSDSKKKEAEGKDKYDMIENFDDHKIGSLNSEADQDLDDVKNALEENNGLPINNVVPLLLKSKSESVTADDAKMMDTRYLKKQLKKYRDLLVKSKKPKYETEKDDPSINHTELEEDKTRLENNLFNEVEQDLDEFVKDLANTNDKLTNTYYYDEYYPDNRVYE